MIRTKNFTFAAIVFLASALFTSASASSSSCYGWYWNWKCNTGNNHHHWNDNDDDDDDCNGGKNCHNNKHNHKNNCGNKPPKDTTPPVITCPPDAKFFCGTPTGPDAQGWATATDDKDTNVKITYKDKVEQENCGANRFDRVIRRTWKATDDACNTATCVQILDVIKIIVSLDAQPGVCPNTFVDGCGYYPITIAGGPSFNVNDIKLSSLKVWAEDCEGGYVKPSDVCFGDVTSYFFAPSICGCSTAGADGMNDLTLWVKKSKMAEKFDFCTLPAGSSFRVFVSGQLNCNGCEFLGTDCITVN